MMKLVRRVGVVSVVLLLAACGLGEEVPGPEQVAEEQARAALQALKQNLMAELTAAVAAEGPAGAIGICRVREDRALGMIGLVLVLPITGLTPAARLGGTTCEGTSAVC